MFPKKESRTIPGTTVSNAYQNQLKKLFAAAKTSTSVTKLPTGGNFGFFYPFKPFSILKFAMTKRFTSATRATPMWLECHTNDTIATWVKNFDFDNDTSENIFSPQYISYMANERLQGEEQFFGQFFWKCFVSMLKCVWKVHHKNWTLQWKKLYQKVVAANIYRFISLLKVDKNLNNLLTNERRLK